MKKLSLFFILLLSINGFSQTPIITSIVDGDCTGGIPKVVELYANGTVDFSQFSLQRQNNADTEWKEPLNLAEFGTVTNDFVYLFSGDAEIFAAEFPSASIYMPTSAISINGDDRVRLIDASEKVIDIFGEDGVSGTGTAWEYKDGFAKRNSGNRANPTFMESEWTFNNGALDGKGVCNNGDTFETVMGGIGTYQFILNINEVAQANTVNMNTVWNETATFNTKGTAKVDIFNINGKLVKTTNGANNFTVNVNNLTQGVYVVKVTVNGKSTIKRVVKK